MPKVSLIQADFSGGEFGPHSDGRVDTEEYQRALAKCYNYIPTLSGPLARRPGTTFVTTVEDPSNPPTFIPFKFSDTQQYMLEFGANYIKFYTDEGIVVTTGTSYFTNGNNDTAGSYLIAYGYRKQESSGPLAYMHSIRPSLDTVRPGQTAITGSAKVVGTELRMSTYFSADEVKDLAFSQVDNKLYLSCSTKPTHVLTRFGHEEWDLEEDTTLDGPYLSLNSYEFAGDNANVELSPRWPFDPNTPANVDLNTHIMPFETRPRFFISNVVNVNSKGLTQITIGNTSFPDAAHNYVVGQKLFFKNVAGAVHLNNSNFAVHESWPVTQIISSTQFRVQISTQAGGYIGSGVVFPAIFSNTNTRKDDYRNVAIVRGSTRYWGYLNTFQENSPLASARDANELRGGSPASCEFILDHRSANDFSEVLVDTSNIKFWYLGLFNSSSVTGHPQAITFHQDRKILAGAPGYPSKFIGSETGFHNSFAPTDPHGIVLKDTNALDFNLVSDNKDPIVWAKSGNRGILFGSLSTEFLVSQSSENQALSPTNVNSEVVSRYGSARAEAVRSGDAIIYVQNSRNKIRELNYFVKVNKHNSILINKFADHITYPGVTQLVAQNEFYPMVYALRTDGVIAAMSFDRDEKTVKSGWAEFELGGKSDSAGTSPNVKTVGVIADSAGKYDQLWMAVERHINGTSVVTVEYMQEPYTPNTDQRDAKYLDCMSTYDDPKTIALILTNGDGREQVSSASHGFVENDRVLITDVVGRGSSLVNVDGIVVNSTLVNDKVFIVSSTSTNEFFLRYENSSWVDGTTYTPYASGGKARKLVSTISGLTDFKNEAVDILADGANHGKATVNSGGILTLNYPAAVVHIGYGYKSQGKLLRKDAGSKRGSAIGMTRRVHEAAFNIEYVGDIAFGMSFDNLHPWDFDQADIQMSDSMTPLFKGIIRGGVQSEYDFDGQVCFEQSSPLPGLIKSITLMMDEYDV